MDLEVVVSLEVVMGREVVAEIIEEIIRDPGQVSLGKRVLEEGHFSKP